MNATEKARETLSKAALNANRGMECLKSRDYSHIPEVEKVLWASALLIQCDLCRQIVFLGESELGLPKLLTIADIAAKLYEAKSWYFGEGNKKLRKIASDRSCGLSYVDSRLRDLKRNFNISDIDKYKNYRNTISFHYDSELPKYLELFGRENSDDFYELLMTYIRFSGGWAALVREVILSN